MAMTNNDFKEYIKKYGANNALLKAETVEHIQIALNAGADVNAKHQISGRTALMNAKTAEQTKLADMDGDGIIHANDARAILRISSAKMK